MIGNTLNANKQSIGGWYINEIVKAHRGELSVPKEADNTFSARFVITLPFETERI